MIFFKQVNNTYNIGTTKPLEIAVPADQQARRKYITNTEHRDLRKERKKHKFVPKLLNQLTLFFGKRVW